MAQERAVFGSSDAASTRFSSIEAEIGWAISDRYQNQGFATEAARALIEYGFYTLQLPRIVAFTHRENRASIRVMEKLGMQLRQYPETDNLLGVIENQSSAARTQSAAGRNSG